MQAAQAHIEEPETLSATVLCVDDEKPILSALKRVFRRTGYKVLLATSGNEALEILANENVDLIISDMRMPEMSGAELLAQAVKKYPDTMRILLTGYADIESSIAAINDGEIYRYISKPWDDKELNLIVQQALEQKFLKDERDRLQKLTKKQNQQLKELNDSLEEKVKARTGELEQTAAMLKKSFTLLEQSYFDTVPVFASLIDLREGNSSNYGKMVANLARSIAEQAKLDEKQQQQIYFAGLLHNIGRLSLKDNVSNRPYHVLAETEKEQLHEYPVTGQRILGVLHPLTQAADIIRSHRERFDGKGFPDQLLAEKIPLGSRVLSIAKDFYDRQNGSMFGESCDRNEAFNFIINNRFRRYDPKLMPAFKQAYEKQHGEITLLKEFKLDPSDLESGMTVKKDITIRDGVVLIKNEQELSDKLIQKIIAMRQELDAPMILVSLPTKQDK